MVELSQDIQYVKGVGPSRVEALHRLGIYTLEDIITYFPREYEDRSHLKKIVELSFGESAAFRGTVVSRMVETKIRPKMAVYKLLVRDETGSILITWFNQPYLKNVFKPGEDYIFFGKVNGTFGKLEMQSPTFDPVGQTKNTGKIIPLYPLTQGITQNVLRTIIENAVKLTNGELADPLPSTLRAKYGLCEINEAVQKIHFPSKLNDFEKARFRIAFEELLTLQLGLLLLKKKGNDSDNGISFTRDNGIQEMIDSLPYQLTGAQARVLKDIEKDMESCKSMNRLVQGDVGSGKTVVAMLAMYKAVKNGYQAAMMAPTAILAKQHYENAKKMYEPFGIRCGLFTSELTKKQKETLLVQLKNKEIDIAIGTHALIEDNIEFANLGLVITDEQHRFGVRQRGILSSKGENVDTLVMTATPIPRTLAIILYGDLDISIIDELPPGRQKIDTYAVGKNMEERVNEFIRKELQKGRQAYIVCPLVEDSENMDLKSVMKRFEYYQEVFQEFNVGFLHGKMKPKDKDAIMTGFKDHKLDVIISTTVIEVGVDVPNATMMVIENAERFGLSQLHQLRGRVGRGKEKSYCILKYESNSKVVKERMDIMQATNDGFVISEKDLELRGPGEFFGTRQHGIPEFKVANLFTDMNILKEAQEAANEILERDINLVSEENQGIKRKVDQLFAERLEL
ncbi:MAG: ATP-dependent DNA helicase RecG [Clostridia bacterium]|nr:ATP-dependent DNA helicase RecG [Clostridia bacterium]